MIKQNEGVKTKYRVMVESSIQTKDIQNLAEEENEPESKFLRLEEWKVFQIQNNLKQIKYNFNCLKY